MVVTELIPGPQNQPLYIQRELTYGIYNCVGSNYRCLTYSGTYFGVNKSAVQENYFRKISFLFSSGYYFNNRSVQRKHSITYYGQQT